MNLKALIKKVEDLQHRVGLAQCGYEFGILRGCELVKSLVDGEHFHAVGTVVSKLPTGTLKDDLVAIRSALDALLVELYNSEVSADTKAGSAPEEALG